MIVRFLTASEIPFARRLLFTVYCEHGGWSPAANNPSGLQVVEPTEGGLPELVDKYDCECKWLGCFDQSSGETDRGRLIGVHRMLVGKASGIPFDIENYITLPTQFQRQVTVEVQRLAIHPEYHNSRAMWCILNFEYEWLKSSGIRFFVTTATFPLAGKMFLKMGMKRSDHPDFFYNEGELTPSSLLYFDFDDDSCLSNAAKYVALMAKLELRKGDGSL